MQVSNICGNLWSIKHLKYIFLCIKSVFKKTFSDLDWQLETQWPFSFSVSLFLLIFHPEEVKMWRTLLTIQNFLRKTCPFKVIVVLVVQTEEEIICQLPAPFIVSTVYPCKSKTWELLGVLTPEKLVFFPYLLNFKAGVWTQLPSWTHWENRVGKTEFLKDHSFNLFLKKCKCLVFCSALHPKFRFVY